jgi:hypothetical protein
MANGTPENVVIEIGKDAGTETISTSIQTGTETTVTWNGCTPDDNAENVAYAVDHVQSSVSNQRPSWIFYAMMRIPGATHATLNGSLMIGLNPAQINPPQGYTSGSYTTYGETGGVQDCNFDTLVLSGGNPTGTSTPIELDFTTGADNKVIHYRPSIFGVSSTGVIDSSTNPFNVGFSGGPGANQDVPWEKFSFDSPSFSIVNSWFPDGTWTSAVDHNSQAQGMSFDGLSLYFIHAESYDYDGRIVGHVFDVISGIGNNLYLLGNGTDDSSLLNVGPLNEQSAGQYYMYASPFQHGANWSEIRQEENLIVFKGLMGNQMICNSYYGAKTNALSNKQWRINPCYDFLDNYFGMRNLDFLKDHDNWNISFTVTDITPGLELRVMQGQPSTYNSSNTFDDIALKITQPGTYSICLPSLKMQFEEDPNFNEIQGGTLSTNHGYVTAVPVGAILFDVQPLPGEDYYNKEIVIEGLDVRKSNPDLTTVVTPTFTQGLSYDINTYDWDRLDVMDSESVPLSLNYSISDLRNLKKKSVGFSKTFKIPANQHNEVILGSMLGVGSERQMIDWMKARIKVDGVVVFKGLFRVEESNTGNGGSYRCHIIQDNITWTGSMGDNTICDLPLLVNEDSNGDQEEKKYSTITSSWSNTPDDSSYFFGLANYGQWNANAANGSHDHNNGDFHPFIFTRSIVDEIFKQTGYTINSAFFDSPFFKQLCHPYTSGEDYADVSNVFDEGGDNNCHATLATASKFSIADADGWGGVRVQTKIWPLIGNPGNHFSSGSGSGNGYTVPFTGYYDIYAKAQVEVHTYTGSFCGHTDHCYCFLQVTKNGAVIDNFSFTESGTNLSTMGGANHQTCSNNGYKVLERGFQILLQAGDIIHMKYKAENYANYCSFKIWAKEQVFDIYPVQSSIIPPAPTDLTKVLPCIKQVDFIQGLTEMFNLQWLADEERKMISVEPYDDFFGSGSIVDWTDKIDTRQWNDKFIIENLAKITAFTYKLDPNDGGMEFLYKWRLDNGYDELYNAHYEDNGMRFRKQFVEMGTKIFHNTWSFNDYDQTIAAGWGWGDMTWNGSSDHNNPIMPILWSEGGGINSESRTPYNASFSSFAMRMLNYYGKNNDVSTWNFVDENNTNHSMDHFPYSGMVNKYAKRTGVSDPYCLTFDDHEHHGVSLVSPGLFTKFWSRAYRMLNGGSALRTCSVYLTANDMSIFDYRDLVHIKIDNVSTYWTVNKIIDFNPSNNELTTVELIEYKDKVVKKSKTKKTKPWGGKKNTPIEGKTIQAMGSGLSKEQSAVIQRESGAFASKDVRSEDACVMYVEEEDGIVHNLVFNEGEKTDNEPLYIQSTKGDDDYNNQKLEGIDNAEHLDPAPEEKKN